MTMGDEKSFEANASGLHDAKILDPQSDTSSENLPPYRKRSRRREIILFVTVAILLGGGLIAVLVYFSARHVFYQAPEAIVRTTANPLTTTEDYYENYDVNARSNRARGGPDLTTEPPVREHRGGGGFRMMDFPTTPITTTTEEQYDPSMIGNGLLLRRGMPGNQRVVTTTVSTDTSTVDNDPTSDKISLDRLWVGPGSGQGQEQFGSGNQNNEAVDRGNQRIGNAEDEGNQSNHDNLPQLKSRSSNNSTALFGEPIDDGTDNQQSSPQQDDDNLPQLKSRSSNNSTAFFDEVIDDGTDNQQSSPQQGDHQWIGMHDSESDQGTPSQEATQNSSQSSSSGTSTDNTQSQDQADGSGSTQQSQDSADGSSGTGESQGTAEESSDSTAESDPPQTVPRMMERRMMIVSSTTTSQPTTEEQYANPA